MPRTKRATKTTKKDKIAKTETQPTATPEAPGAREPVKTKGEPLGLQKLSRLPRSDKMKRLFNRFFSLTALLGACLVAGSVWAAQDTDINLNEVRDPRKLKTWLEANALDAETRLAALGSTASSTMVLTNSVNEGGCYIEMTADTHGDAGDRLKINFADGGTLTIGTDADSKGTIATKLSMGKTGIVTMKGGTTLDNTTDTGKLTITETAVDIAGALSANSLAIDAGAGVDAGSAGALTIGASTATSINYGSGSVTAHTFTSDGTGTSEVVMPAGSVDGTEILDGTIQAIDIGDAELSALGGLASAANKIPYFTGSGTAALIGSSANVITFLAAADNAAMAVIIAGAVAEGGLANSTVITDDIKDGTIREADLMIVDSPTDEDVLTYEETTGDFEWHSVAQIIAQMGEGGLPNDSILEADLKAVDSASDEDILTYESTTGDFEWHSVAEIMGKVTEGQYANSTIVAADIKDGEIGTNELKVVDIAADEDFLTYEASVGDFEWHSAADVAGSIAAAIAEGQLANSTVVSADIKDGEIVDADVSATAAISQSKLACSGVGAVVDAAASATETADGLVVTVITFTNVVMVATDGSDEGESVQVFDFDAGAFTILSAVLNATATLSAGATGASVLSLGTVAAADDSALTSTEVDVIPSTSVTGAGANAVDAVLAATIVMDGTGTAKDLYVNWAIDDDNMDANTTNTVTGTITLITTKAIDN